MLCALSDNAYAVNPKVVSMMNNNPSRMENYNQRTKNKKQCKQNRHMLLKIHSHTQVFCLFGMKLKFKVYNALKKYHFYFIVV